MLFNPNQFPKLFLSFKSSEFNNLVAMFDFMSVFIYDTDGNFLDIKKTASLYDRGEVTVTFLNKEYFLINLYDDNNGSDTLTYQYINNKIVLLQEVNDEQLLELILKNDAFTDFKILSDDLKQNKSIVLKIFNHFNLENNHRVILIDKNIIDDYDVAKASVNNFYLNYEVISETQKANKEIAILAIPKHKIRDYKDFFGKFPDSLKSDYNFVCKAISINSYFITCVKSSIEKYEELVLLASQENKELIALCPYLISDNLKNDENFALEAVKINGSSIFYFSDDLQNNSEIILAAINNHFSIASKLINKMNVDSEMAKKIVTINPALLEYLPNFKDNINIARHIISKNFQSFKYLSKEIKGNYEFAVEVLNKSTSVYEYLEPELKTNQGILKIFEVKKIEDDNLPF
jgi:hypothetical protein